MFYKQHILQPAFSSMGCFNDSKCLLTDWRSLFYLRGGSFTVKIKTIINIFHRQLVWFNGLYVNTAFFLKMKFIYTILFFTDTLALIVLCFLLLKQLDNNITFFTVALLVLGIVCSILLLVYFISQYIKLPGSKK